jgi:hypothetical protein
VTRLIKQWHVRYRYLATGMEGRADQEDHGTVEAATAEEAKDIMSMRQYPTDIMYGPGNSYSTRQFFRDCLTADSK